MGRFNDITGRKFGRLTVLSREGKKSKQTNWNCLCDCGQTLTVIRHSLISGATLSCGCYQSECAANLGSSRASGKKAHPKEYSVWSGMKRRCENPNDRSYHRYGGRGVEVRYSSFDDFLSDVGERPTDEHQIDRIDNDGHYEAGNCNWSTRVEQAGNRRVTLKVSFQGEQMPLKQACEIAGIEYRKAWNRINVLGWSIQDALQK